MLRKETVETRTLDLIKQLMAEDIFSDFNLVGGTALSLMIGHRMSIDIDLFTNKDFNSEEIADYLSKQYKAESIQSIKNGVFCFIHDIKIDILAHQYPLVGTVETVEGIRMISLLDIAAMKLNAIYDNGTRLKDFVDIYALLQYFPLQQLLHAFEQKYPDISPAMVKNALVYHDDVKLLDPIDFVGPKIKWPTITERLIKAFHDPQLTFGLPETTQKLIEKQRQDQKGENKGPKL